MKIIIAGLGNPGRQYEKTRHNFGFFVVDKIADGDPWKTVSGAEVCKKSIASYDVILVKPQTYMNRSGEPLRAVTDYFNSDVSRLIVCHDEIDIPFGDIRVKKGGGEAGHNGLKSITQQFSTKEYYRVRLGVGRSAIPEIEVADWVLSRFVEEETKELPGLVNRAIGEIERLLPIVATI